jgi:hypothetical protein
MGEALPDFGEPFPKLGGGFPNFGEVFPNLGGRFPKIGEALPHFGEALPSLREVFPYFGEICPRRFRPSGRLARPFAVDLTRLEGGHDLGGEPLELRRRSLLSLEHGEIERNLERDKGATNAPAR